MTNKKVEKNIIIYFIGLIVTLFAILGGDMVLKAELPANTKTQIDFGKQLQSLEKDLETGKLSLHQFDSLSIQIRLQKERNELFTEETRKLDKMPEWVKELGISVPEGMKFDKVFSEYTSVDDPTEGFNSVSLVYTGNYETAIAEAQRIAASAHLEDGGVHFVKNKSRNVTRNSMVNYLNYSLENANQDYLISVQVVPSGRLTIMVTDNKQLNERLLVYEPLNNRQNNAAKRKKQ